MYNPNDNNLLTINKNKYFRYFLYLILITLFHTVFIEFIKIMEVTPDLFVILVIWITLKDGRFTGLIAGFVIGLFFDIISADVPGTNALAKIVAALVASYFYKERNTAQITENYKFLWVIFLSVLAHNIIYFLFYIKVDDVLFYMKYGFATTIYTTFFGLIFLLKIPSKSIKF